MSDINPLISTWWVGLRRQGRVGWGILDPYLTPHLKLKCQYFKNLNVKLQSFKSFKKNTCIQKTFLPQSGKGFINKKKEKKSVKEKMNNFDCSET